MKRIKCVYSNKIFNFDSQILQPEPNKCDSETFQQVLQLGIIGKFETKTGQPELEAIPVFMCTSCGSILDLAAELKNA